MKFTKQILRPGKYVVRSPGGGRSEEEVTPDRLRRYAATFAEMRGNGLRIPAPWRHDKSAPLSQEVKDSRDYGGYWEETWIDNDGSLYGKLDAPLAADAEKIGATVTEVSPYILPEWTDGKGRKYDDAMLHIALVQHPVEPGQTNFVPDKADNQPAMALSLSQLIEGAVEFADEVANSDGAGAPPSGQEPAGEPSPDKASNPTIQDVLAALSAVGLSLPEDTTPLNLAERIVVAAKALEGKKEQDREEEAGGQPGGESKQQPLPIAMADEPMVADMKVSEDGLAITFETKEARQRYEQQSEKSLEFSAGLVRDDYKRRVEELVRTGRITPDYYNKKLRPLMDGFELSLGGDGQRVPSQLDTVLDALESLPENATGMGNRNGRGFLQPTSRNPLAGMQMSFEEPMPPGYEAGGEITEERAKEVVDQQLVASGKGESS